VHVCEATTSKKSYKASSGTGYTNFNRVSFIFGKSCLSRYMRECLKKICPASFREACQWLKFPLNGLRVQSRLSPVVGLQPLASGPACLGMAFPPFLMKELYRCDSVVISSFVRTGYTMRRWEWLLGRVGYSITHHYPLYPTRECILIKENKRSTSFSCRFSWKSLIQSGLLCRPLAPNFTEIEH